MPITLNNYKSLSLIKTDLKNWHAMSAINMSSCMIIFYPASENLLKFLERRIERR